MFGLTKKLKIVLEEGAKAPRYAHEEDACMDIYSNEECIIRSKEYCVVKTGVHIEVPKGYEILIRSRSGLAAKHGIAVLNSPGTIDCGYTGEIGVILINHGKEDFKIERYDRIAQMCLKRVIKTKFELVDTIEDTDRGSKGFGSTGV